MLLNSSAILSSVSVEGILVVVPRAASCSRTRSRTGPGAGAVVLVFVVGFVLNIGTEELGGGRGAEEELLGGKLFIVSGLVRSGGA